jgi:hypothetical protein
MGKYLEQWIDVKKRLGTSLPVNSKAIDVNTLADIDDGVKDVFVD